MQPQSGNALSVGDAIGYGWNTFKKNPGPLIIIALVVLVLNGALSTVGNNLGRHAPGLAIAFQFAGFLVSILLALGLIRVALKVTSGGEAEVSDLFSGDNFGAYLGASILFGLMVGIGLILCIVPGIIAGVIFGFYGYVIVDRGLGIGDAFSRASEITKGQRGTVFLLALAFFGINLLGALLCGVGLLVSYPVTIVAGGYAYRVLSGEPVVPVAP
jgi:uncharacterized membrane protein